MTQTLDVDLASGADVATPAREPTLARVLDALRGLGERRAIVALLAAALSGTLVGGILTVAVSIFGGFVAVIAGLVVALALAAGLHAAGLLQMDAERGIGQRSVTDALSQGLQALPLLLLVGLALFAVVATVLIAVALLLAVTKIPFLGPLLFVVVFPLSIVGVGVTIAGAGIALAFAMGALWQGASPLRALAQTLVVLRRRAVPTLGRCAALGFVAAATLGVVLGVLSLGVGPVAALSSAIVGLGGGAGFGVGVAGALQASGGHVAAGAIGGFLLWAAALSLVAQVWLRGICGVYLDMSEGVDAGASEARLRDRVGEARRRTATAVPVNAAPTAPSVTAAAASAAAAGVGAAAEPEGEAPAGAPSLPRPPWDESTSPSTSAASTLAGPTDFARLQRAAFGESTTLPSRPASSAPAAAPMPDHGHTAAEPAPSVSPSTAASAAAAVPPTEPPTPAAAGDIDLLLDDAAAAPPPAAVPTCPACSAEVAPDDLFCNRCGQRLGAAA